MSDLIRREDAINAIHKEFDEVCVWDESGQATANEVENILYEVPSAEPERTVGKWTEKQIFSDVDHDVIPEWQSAKCSVCGKYHTTPYLYYFDNYPYCPNCGSEMRGKNE